MAGGNFDMKIGKSRPGVYVNTRSKKQQKPNASTRGIAVVPLIGYDWGPDKEFLKLSIDAPDACEEKLGRSVYDDNDQILLVREILKNAVTCYVYIINPGVAAKAQNESGLVATAAYPGARGNDIRIVSTANVAGGFDVMVYLGAEIVEKYEGVADMAGLLSVATGSYVKFGGLDATLTEFASLALEGGDNGTVANSMITEFMDKAEGIRWHTMCFPVSEKTLQTACIAKIRNMRASSGKWVQAVLPSCGADDEGIINVTNSVVLDDGTETGKTLTKEQACAWVAGITAAASKTASNTYHEYDGAIAVAGVKTDEEAELAVSNGEFFFTVSEGGKPVVEYDINSLHTFSEDKTQEYSKNRVIRVYDSFAEDVALTFPPNKFDNDEDGWMLMEGLGRALLQQYEEEGAIQNVDLESDFYVDRSTSRGEETYFSVGLQAVDSAEKMYFSVSTR